MSKAIKFFVLILISGYTTVNMAAIYVTHTNIWTTTFWVGEPASNANGGITNVASAWDEEWQASFGGFDDPNNRNGFQPAAFIPKQNPFYFALPYNDIDDNGARKTNLPAIVAAWADGNTDIYSSVLQGRWIKITNQLGLEAYAQWQDVGPFGEDDEAYVFGNSTAVPNNSINNHAGLDLSPATRDFLGLTGLDQVDWQFVDEADVPNGEWTTNFLKVSAVPIPASIFIFAPALIGLLGLRRKARA